MSLPTGYIEVEYIATTGTQYINTGFCPDQSTRVVMDAQFDEYTDLKITHTYFRCKSTYTFGVMDPSSAYNRIYAYYGSVYSNIWDVSVGNRRTIDMNGATITIDGVTKTYTETTFEVPVPLYLFASNENGTANYFASGKIYSCRIYDNGTLVRNFVPCINPSDAAGMYDTVNGVFYGNSGSGVFVAGEPVGAKVGGQTTVDGVWKQNTEGYANVGGVWKQIVEGYTNVYGVWTPIFTYARYAWAKYSVVTTQEYILKTDSSAARTFTSTSGGNILVGESCSVDQNTGEISLADTRSVQRSYYSSYAGTYPYYSYMDVIYKHATINNSTQFVGYKMLSELRTEQNRGAFIENVSAMEENAYPADGIHTDGYWYVKQ